MLKRMVLNLNQEEWELVEQWTRFLPFKTDIPEMFCGFSEAISGPGSRHHTNPCLYSLALFLLWPDPCLLPSPVPPLLSFFFLLWFLREGLHILLCIQWLGTHWILQARPTWEYSISLCSAGISGTLHLVPASWHHCHSTPCCRFWYQEGFDIKTRGNQLQVSHSYQDHTP